jgi:hypothetical protein
MQRRINRGGKKVVENKQTESERQICHALAAAPVLNLISYFRLFAFLCAELRNAGVSASERACVAFLFVGLLALADGQLLLEFLEEFALLLGLRLGGLGFGGGGGRAGGGGAGVGGGVGGDVCVCSSACVVEIKWRSHAHGMPT